MDDGSSIRGALARPGGLPLLLSISCRKCSYVWTAIRNEHAAASHCRGAMTGDIQLGSPSYGALVLIHGEQRSSATRSSDEDEAVRCCGRRCKRVLARKLTSPKLRSGRSVKRLDYSLMTKDKNLM